MARLRQTLLPDEMQDIPIGAENVTPWIDPHGNIEVIGTPNGPRYIQNNEALIQRPTGDYTQEIPVNTDAMTFNEIQALGRMMSPGPPPSSFSPEISYATNIPSTAKRWASEGKLEGDNSYFLTNTPEETRQAREKGYGKWGKIIGPPEAAVPAKKESPYPGPPPTDEQTGDLNNFKKFWNAHVQENWGGIDPLKMNPGDAREAAEKAVKDKNDIVLFQYENYGPANEQEKLKYTSIMKQIKDAGDLAEKKAEETRNNARREQVLALDFWKQNIKKNIGESRLDDVEKEELKGIRADKREAQSEIKKWAAGADLMPESSFANSLKEAKAHLDALTKREAELLRKESGPDLTQPSLMPGQKDSQASKRQSTSQVQTTKVINGVTYKKINGQWYK